MLIIKYITSERHESAFRLLLGLYAGADAWIHFMTPIVKKRKMLVVRTTSACLNMCSVQSFHDGGQAYVLTWPERRSA